jgi:hypothetical protein
MYLHLNSVNLTYDTLQVLTHFFPELPVYGSRNLKDWIHIGVFVDLPFIKFSHGIPERKSTHPINFP